LRVGLVEEIFLNKALERYLLFKIEKVQVDNGSEFLGELEDYLREKE